MRDDGLCVVDNRGGATETGGEGEFSGVEFFLENVKRVVIRAGKAVDGLMTVADSDEVARRLKWFPGFTLEPWWLTVLLCVGVIRFELFEHPFGNLPPSGIGVLGFVDKHKVELWEGKILFQRHVDHVVEVDFRGVLEGLVEEIRGQSEEEIKRKFVFIPAEIMVSNEALPLGGVVGEKEAHPRVFGNRNCLADGLGKFPRELVGSEPRVEDVRELEGIGFAGAEGLLEGGEPKAVNRVDFNPLSELELLNAMLEFIADLGVEGHEGDAFGGLDARRVPAIDDVGDHLDNSKCLTTARHGFDDEVALWIVGPLDTRQLFLGKIG